MRRVISSTKLYVLVLTTILFLCGPVTSYAFSFFGGGSGSSSKAPTVNPASLPGVKLSSVQDTYIDQRKANNSFGTNSNILLSSRSRQVKQGLMKFNISGVPTGATVTKAKLWVYVAKKGGSRSSISVYEAMGTWSRTTTWSKKPQMSGSSKGSVSVSKAGDYYAVDVTGLVQDWVEGKEQNNGIYIVTKSGEIYVNSAENKKYKPVLTVEHKPRQTEPTPTPVATPVPTPVPTPVATPVPTPSPTTPPGPVPTPIPTAPPSGGSGDSGVSDAPLAPANLRILVVAKDGSGNYTTIQAAVNNSKPGDTIQVKEGVYKEGVSFTKSGTSTQPIALMNFPGHSPVIDPGGGKYPSDFSLRVELSAEWIIIEGFEVKYGWDGVKVYKPHNTIRNNWIHHNRYQGILVVSTSDVFIESNTIEYNGTDPGACYNSEWGGESPKHCHGIYMSDYSCTGMSDITIRGSVLSNHGGRGIQWNGYGCSSKMQNTLVENNIIENNSWGMVLYHNVENSIIINNTFVMEKYPSTDDTSHTFVSIWKSTQNIIKNNIFYSTRSDVAPIQTHDSESGQNTLDYNLWKVNTNSWKWKGGWRSDFSSSYKSITGWDSNSLFNVNPGFYNVSSGIYDLTASSPARDRGLKSECSPTDFDKEIRVDSYCDIGMDEYSN
jgi:parallel beta-helix repeat protein